MIESADESGDTFLYGGLFCSSMVSIGTSLTYTLLDFAYLFNRDSPFMYKVRVSLTYVRLTAQFFIHKLLRTDKTSSRVLGLKVSFSDFSTFAFLFREVFIKQEYLFKAGKKPVIVDCGANIGMSVLFFKYHYPDATVYGFEPLPGNFKHLQQNVKQNRLSKVTVFEAAVAAKNGRTTFYFDNANAEALTSSIYSARSGKAKVSVKTVRLSDFVKKVHPDLLKIDIEGAEFEVLKDMQSSGALKYVKSFVIEYHHLIGNGASLSEFLGILENAGFVCYLDAALAPRSNNEDIIIYALRR